ncbi:restriction endonuclease subunit S [Vibrio owensii]|uniref:restriction endonuclease subunit S n=1 Tax=Vibrio owensii TaxID=696485 RepID=UPI0005EF2E7F|nr:restriction endonuclease subunit S [Vibrio owensii]
MMEAVEIKDVQPEGYRVTDAGVIPSDWRCLRIEQICNLINGRGFKPHEWGLDGLPIIRIQNLNGSQEFNFFDGAYDKKLEIEEGQLLFAWSGSRGTSFGPHIWHGQKALLNYHTWKVVKTDDSVDSQYFYFALKALTKVIEESAHGASALVHTQMGEMKKFVVPVPPTLKEQTAIANALSDFDVLISELEKLIAKKQAIKTATMQQLLTGKKRLPQFAKNEDGTLKGYKESELGDIPEDWDVIDFGELFEESIAKNIPKGTEVVTFLGMQDVSENAQLLNQSLIRYSKVKSGFTYFEKGDVLVAKITPCFENGKGCHTENLGTQVGFGSTEFHVLRAKGNSDSKFVYFWTTRKSFRVDLEAEMVGSAGHRRVPLSALSSYKIPSSLVKEEQTAIAEILTDMEADVQALEQRLAKTRQIKQGMMQELLTGKTRLVKPESK